MSLCLFNSPGLEIFGTKIFSKTFILYFWNRNNDKYTYEVDLKSILNISETS